MAKDKMAKYFWKNVVTGYITLICILKDGVKISTKISTSYIFVLLFIIYYEWAIFIIANTLNRI